MRVLLTIGASVALYALAWGAFSMLERLREGARPTGKRRKT